MNTAASARPNLVGPKALPFLLMHLTPIALIWVGFSWEGVALCIGSYYLRIFGVTAGYHRYFSHRSFTTGRVFQFILAFLAMTTAQKGVLWWASHHRHHHRHSDGPDDVHSPVQRGFWYSHIGWILEPRWQGTDARRVKDLTRYPELVWLDRHYLVPPVLFAVAILAIWGWHGLVWGFFISTILTWHGTFTINSLSHVIGNKQYATTDDSRNNFVLALITMGEGWHNNHHHYQRSCAQGWHWYQLDLTYLVLKGLEALRIVQGVGKPPQHIIDDTLASRRARADEMVEALRARVESLEAAAGAMANRAEAWREELRELAASARGSMETQAANLQESVASLAERADVMQSEIQRALNESELDYGASR